MKKINKYLGVFCIVFIVFWLMRNEYKNYQIKHDFKITIGRVNQITKATYKNNNRSILYEYNVDGEKHFGENSLASCDRLNGDKLRLLLVNQSFPVAYSIKDKNYSIIILTIRDAEEFNYKIPDSMMVYDSVLSCK